MTIVYTLIQIIIESFPISSSTHARLFCGTSCVSDSYDYFLHGFTVLVILAYFFKEYFFLLRHMYRARGALAKLFFTAVIADCVTAVFYFVLPYTALPQLPIPIGLTITACALLSTSPLTLSLSKGLNEQFSWSTRAALIGFVQGIALLPGISRMGTTYVAARWMGMRPYRAMALSLLVQLPLIGAGFLKGLYGLYRTHELVQYLTFPWIALYIFATIGAYLGLCITMYSARHEKMWIFGVYLLFLLCCISRM